MDSALANLLAPHNVEAFLQNHWTQKGLFISSQGDRRFDYLFSWKKLTELLNFHEFDFPVMRLALDGKVLDPSDNQHFVKRCQEGATLILDRVHKFVPEINQFASALRYETGHPVQVNTYCSYPEKQGFRCHYDTHEVFILQVDGCKQWYVFPDTFKYPLINHKSVDLTPPEGEAYLSCVLHPGDLLYIPRGHWHYAVALEQPSLHLTLGILCKTGIDLLEWLINDLRDQEIWRENLPLIANHPDLHINGLIQKLAQCLIDRDIGSDYAKFLAMTERSLPEYAFPYQAGFQIFAQGMQTQFRRPQYQQPEIQELVKDEAYQIRVCRKEVKLQGVTGTFVHQLFSKEHFTGAEIASWLPGFDWEAEIQPMLTRLVTEGLIFVEDLAFV
ncbi:MAG: cupin [Leptolyngbyaceae cyanobacterium CSU_1_3]|nr:cupin [Leptolyngbyaceae cyanobacterium CSU_1_3]